MIDVDFYLENWPSNEENSSEESTDDELPPIPPLQRWLWQSDMTDILGEPIWDSPGYRLVYGEDGDEELNNDSDSFWNGQPEVHRDVVPLQALVWARDKTELRSLKCLSGYQLGFEEDEYSLCGIVAEFTSQSSQKRRTIGRTQEGNYQASSNKHATGFKRGEMGDFATMHTDSDISPLQNITLHFDIDGAGGEIITEILVARLTEQRAIKARKPALLSYLLYGLS